MNGKKGVYFAVWAPNAATVSVIGEFNGWREEANPMTRLEPSGIYEGFVVGAKVGMLYKFFIKTKDGRGLYKADPFANYAEQRPGTASRITDITKLKWSDAAWMEARKQRDNDSFRFLFMKYIRVPGRNIRMERTRMDSIITESLRNHLQNM